MGDSPSSTSRTCWKEPDTALQHVLWASSDPQLLLGAPLQPTGPADSHTRQLPPSRPKTDQRCLSEATSDTLCTSDILDRREAAIALAALEVASLLVGLNSTESHHVFV